MLVVRDLQRSFKSASRGTILAVDSVSLRVDAGEIYGLLGPNGAGKTTTLRVIATLLQADGGSVHIDGVDVSARPLEARRRMAWVPAEAGLPERLRPREVVSLFARIQGVSDPRGRADALLERLGARDWADAPCGSLSTGMKRRVVLARALVHDPKVLLLDEPTDGLDVSGRRQVLGLVQELAAEGRAVVLSSHILGEVERVCGRVGVLSKGRLVAESDVETLRAELGGLEEAFLHLVGEGG